LVITYPLTPSLVREGEDGLEGAMPLPKYFPLSFEERGLRGEAVRAIQTILF
jgi:hypothetical protein